MVHRLGKDQVGNGKKLNKNDEFTLNLFLADVMLIVGSLQRAALLLLLRLHLGEGGA